MAQTVTAVVSKPNNASSTLRTNRKMERENLLPKVVIHAVAHIHPHIPKNPHNTHTRNNNM